MCYWHTLELTNWLLTIYGALTMWCFTSCWSLVATETSVKNYCSDEPFIATCSDDDVITIDSSLYGRMSFGTCVQRDYGYIGCHADVTRVLANKCSGRRSCEVANLEALFSSYNRCPPDLKAYLQAGHSCQKVTQPIDKDHCLVGYVEPLPPPIGSPGTFASLEQRWGTPTCPWRILAQAGQRINLTLHDYSDYGNTGDDNPAFCRQYMTVNENDIEKKIVSCSHESRDRQVYISEGNDIYVVLATKPESEQSLHFLLDFEVVGCPTPHLPANAYSILNPDGSTTVQCNFTSETWKMHCTNGKWDGRMKNCSEKIVEPPKENLIPLGVSIVIIVGVALLVCTGVLVVGFLVIYCKRRSRRKHREDEQRMFATYSKTHHSAMIINSRTKHASLEKTRAAGYSPLTKTRTVRHAAPGVAGEYTHIWEVKHPIPVSTPEVPKTHICFHHETITAARSSPTMTSTRSPTMKRRPASAKENPMTLTRALKPANDCKAMTLVRPIESGDPKIDNQVNQQRSSSKDDLAVTTIPPPPKDTPAPSTETNTKTSPTRQCDQEIQIPRLPTFSTFRPDGGLYECTGLKSPTAQCTSHSSQSSPLYFEIDTRKKATNHYST